MTFALGRTLFRYDLDAAKAAEEAEKRKAEPKKARRRRRSPSRKPRRAEASGTEEAGLRSTPTEVIVEAPRARPIGTVLLRGARIITMNGDRSDRERRHRRQGQPDRGGRAGAVRCRLPPASGRSTSPARRSCRASSTSTRTSGRPGASTRRRSGSTSRTSPTA